MFMFFRDNLRHGQNVFMFYRDNLRHGRNGFMFFRDNFDLKVKVLKC